MNRLNKVYVPFRVEYEFKSDTSDTSESIDPPGKKKEIVYLPGERLLIRLNKQNNKNNIDIDRIYSRMTSILKDF
tara:strand:- start:719 stop:943 length:225 start_codon:yes stop_codon:yes gene_type:complete